MKKYKGIFLYLVVFIFSIGGCASTAPLPATLDIVPPSSDVPREIAAFSGVWTGKLRDVLDTILVVEKINIKKAEIIVSIGQSAVVSGSRSSYFYATAEVLPGPAIEWTAPDGARFVYRMDKGLNSISGFIEEKSTGAKWWVHMTRKQ